ncbi:fimbrillin family protein [Parabacteroides merdae]|uniref:fimbrillin family protein n=1 Tax=Parabacteroides merdae TaxID=46503 RepID=UPI002096ACFE|nr:fimbrillin family protein [Parabacteroides merdae]MCO7169335.1 fimbrillin family protein [Parabacteroides merdae]
MKIIRNIARRPWPRIGGWLPVMMLICGVLASCSSEDESTAPLPDGKYPLQLTAEVAQPQTRAGGKDAWTGGEEIRVSLEGVFGNKTYVMDASGNASPKDADNAFYWKNTAEDRISAWTPDLEVETDISDQTKGYAAFDVLYASAIGRYDQAINLRFLHRMAKIEVTLKAGEGITEEELEDATVTIFGDPLTHSTAGLVAPGDQSDGEIKPYYDAATKKYEALVPPQNMTGKPLVRISIGGNAFTYAPDTEAAGKFDFFGGKRYAYAITVKANGIDVKAVTGATWSDGGEENITSKKVKQSFTADELKIGDYFYSDGTWSDGGLRKRYDDGSVAIAEPKPAPVMVNPATGAGRAVVGIVFQTDKSRIGAKEKEKLGGEDKAHGLVMALKDAGTGKKWGPKGQDEGLNKCNTKAENYNDISGYGNCEHIRTNRGNFDNYPAFKAAYDYNTTCPVPATTTGWYLPASGQWWDIMQNLGGCPALADVTQQTSLGSESWSNQGDIAAALNKWMEDIAVGDKDAFQLSSERYYLSSSEYSGLSAQSWVMYSNILSNGWFHKDNPRYVYVRPVLAF